jgi:hypothetical protein
MADLHASSRFSLTATDDETNAASNRPLGVLVPLGMKWESRALRTALDSSAPLTCIWRHLRKHEDGLVAGMWMHSWGSRGRPGTQTHFRGLAVVSRKVPG